MIDRDAPGVTHAPLPKVGTHCISASSVYFDNVEINLGGFLNRVMQPILTDETGLWIADYVRLRFRATLPG